MSGMDRSTGGGLDGLDHLRQSVTDILTTPVGSRVMRRDYGSALPDLIDAPINGQTVVDLYIGTAEALERWEPRLNLSRVQLAEATPGALALAIQGEAGGEAFAFEVELRAAA